MRMAGEEQVENVIIKSKLPQILRKSLSLNEFFEGQDPFYKSLGQNAPLFDSRYLKLRNEAYVKTVQFMSFIIDDLIFQHCKTHKEDTTQGDQVFEALEQLSKNFTLNQGAIVLNYSPRKYQTINKLKLQKHEYSVRLTAQAKMKSIRIEAKLLQQESFKRINSKHNAILFLKEIAKRQFQTNNDYPFCIWKGFVIMVQKMYYFLFDPIHSKKAAQFYNSTFSKNFKEFQQFVSQQTNYIYKGAQKNLTPTNNFNEDLFFSQNLCSSNINFDVWQDASQFQAVEQQARKKQIQIKKIVSQIVQAKTIQQMTNLLFLKVPQELYVGWIRDNLERKFEKCSKNFEKILKVGKFVGEKKIDDFIFNMVKVVVTEYIPKPLSQGGSCQVFLAKAEMEFINSMDNSSYFKNEQKRSKLIAIKKLKPEFEKKFVNKLKHQKNIVAKLKGGASYFIPKYYKAEDALEKNDRLLMEYIQGEELEQFIGFRQETISIWTKICILLNIVNGMRYLATYNITHLDLKPSNIMVCKNNYLISKIIDFGQAHHPKVQSKSPYPGYTFPYVAPEALISYDQSVDEQLDVSQKQDVFSFGVIMYNILFNNSIFQFTPAKFKEIYTKKEIFQRFLLAFQKLEDYGDNSAISSLANIMIRCIDIDPGRRPRFDWLGISLRLILNSFSGTS